MRCALLLWAAIAQLQARRLRDAMSKNRGLAVRQRQQLAKDKGGQRSAGHGLCALAASRPSCACCRMDRS
jgi:hypothetical protein